MILQAIGDKKKQSVLKQIKALLIEQMPARESKAAALFCDQYFKRVPLHEVTGLSPELHAIMITGQLEFLRQRNPGQLLIRVFNSPENHDDQDYQNTVVEMANDDMPFLVDTVSMVMQEMKLAVRLIVHPVINAQRDQKGALESLHPEAGKQTQKESFIRIHLEKQTDPGVLAEVESRLKARMEKVRIAVADWRPMEEYLGHAIAEFGKNAPGLSDSVRKECISFLKWVSDDNFVFIGVRSYDIARDGNTTSLKIVKGTGLGLLREHGKPVLSRPLDNFSSESSLNQDEPLIITKTNNRSPMHRGGYMDYIGVLRYDEKGTVIGEFRIIGLFTSMAYRQRVEDIPLLSMKINNVLQGSGLQENRHAWKTLLHILETLPRDDVMQASSSELLAIATGVLDLQERQTVRLFVRKERFGRFFSCLAYIPRDHWNTENREKIQRILKRASRESRSITRSGFRSRRWPDYGSSSGQRPVKIHSLM